MIFLNHVNFGSEPLAHRLGGGLWVVSPSSGSFRYFSHLVLSFSCDPMDCSSPGSSTHGILQARILEWVFMPFSRGSSGLKSSNPGLLHRRWILYPLESPGKPLVLWVACNQEWGLPWALAAVAGIKPPAECCLHGSGLSTLLGYVSEQSSWWSQATPERDSPPVVRAPVLTDRAPWPSRSHHAVPSTAEAWLFNSCRNFRKSKLIWALGQVALVTPVLSLQSSSLNPVTSRPSRGLNFFKGCDSQHKVLIIPWERQSELIFPICKCWRERHSVGSVCRETLPIQSFENLH